MGRESALNLAVQSVEAEGVQTVSADHLVFTSLKTRGQQGYRIVAASAGVNAQEKRRFQTVSPSHQALTNDTENGVGISYYPLATGRYCVAISSHAGAEPSGRGGFRVYTHGVILGEAGMAAFDWNPFNVLYAMSRWEPDLEPPERMEPVLLTVGADNQFVNAITQATQTFDVEWLRFLVETVIGGRRIVVPCGDDPMSVARTLFMALPASIRKGASFSAGIRYSLGRQLTMNFLAQSESSLRRLLLGQPVVSVNLSDVSEMPVEASSAWGRMVERCWRQRSADVLVWLTGQLLSESHERALDDIAGANIALLEADVASAEDLPGVVEHRADWHGDDEVVRQIIDRFWSAISRRLTYWLDRIDAEGGALLGKAIAELVLRRPVLIGRIGGGLADCLLHWAWQEPVDAGEAAVLLAQRGALADVSSKDRLQAELFDALVEGQQGSDASLSGRVNEVVRAWREIVPPSSSIPTRPV